MREILTAILDKYRELWLREVEHLEENPGNEIFDYHRKIYLAKYVIAERAVLDFENGEAIDLNDLANRLDGVRVKPPTWAAK